MPITANTLYHDSINFFKNQLLNIVILSVLAALVTTLLEHFLMPNGEQLKLLIELQNALKEGGNAGIRDFAAQLTSDEQIMFLHTAFGILFCNIFGNTLITASVLVLIHAVSHGQQTNAIHASTLSMKLLPKMFLLMFICTLLVQIGYALMFLPGILFSITFALAPIFLFEKGKSVFSAMQESWKLAFSNMRLLIPAMLLWFAVKLMLELVSVKIPGIAVSMLNNLLSALLLIYLFRLYMLVKPQNTTTNGM
ncbi:YciC family protein [Xenorhabdus khoisanae]|uniref:YciC family protein n=1 Tax=Xenorhabdus khoisanae TaxID=880157 RepID=UPI002358BC64|nr:YciC family protein [Xenorhabdus khoisanae]MDC9612623.1 YciC family protein [Xenorhabdus khoisanae]